MRDKNRIASLLAIGIIFCAGMLCRHYPQIGSWYFTYTPLRCPLKEWLGLACAFCGMTHAWFYFCQGEISRSVQANALFFPLLISVLVGLTANASSHSIELKPKQKESFMWVSLIVLSVYVVVRNVI